MRWKHVVFHRWPPLAKVESRSIIIMIIIIFINSLPEAPISNTNLVFEGCAVRWTHVVFHRWPPLAKVDSRSMKNNFH